MHLRASTYTSLTARTQITADIVRKAEQGGIKALCITVDAPQLGRREKDMRNKFSAAPPDVQKKVANARTRTHTHTYAHTHTYTHIHTLSWVYTVIPQDAVRILSVCRTL